MSIDQSSINVTNNNEIKSAFVIGELLEKYINRKNITNLLELYNMLIIKKIKSNNSYGVIRICRIHSEELEMYGNEIYQISVRETISEELNPYARLYPKCMELIDVSPIHANMIKFIDISVPLLNFNLIVYVILKKLSNYKVTDNLNFFNCDKETILSTFYQTIDEFNNYLLIDLLNKYDINDESINKVKSELLFKLKLITQDNDQCNKCEKVLNIEKINDIYNANKMLTKSDCCNSYKITDTICSNFQIEITI